MPSSNQNVSTPWPLIYAIEKHFDISFGYDMAASSHNAKAPKFFTEKDNSLAIAWPRDAWLWLNPTFRNLTKWIDKCNQEKNLGSKIISIWPLSGDKNQITTYQNAEVYILHGRVWPQVRGCMICRWDRDSFITPVVCGLEWDGERLVEIW